MGDGRGEVYVYSRECTGNQYFGRCACGLNHLDQTFAVSPYYFDYSEYDDPGKIKMEKGRVMGRGSDFLIS